MRRGQGSMISVPFLIACLQAETAGRIWMKRMMIAALCLLLCGCQSVQEDTPVSYTHLAVYKRQPVGRHTVGHSQRKTSSGCTFFSGSTVETQLEMLCGCLRHSADCADYRLDPDGYFSIYHAVSDAVSYTHLDHIAIFLRQGKHSFQGLRIL